MKRVYLCHCDDPSKTAFHSCDSLVEAFDWYVYSIWLIILILLLNGLIFMSALVR